MLGETSWNGARVESYLFDEPGLLAWGKAFGRSLAPPAVVGVEGELGSGKTTLIRAICRGLGVKEPVTSPTFALVHIYRGGRAGQAEDAGEDGGAGGEDAAAGGGEGTEGSAAGAEPRRAEAAITAYHVDCYRLRGSDDLRDLGFDDMAADPSAVVLIEWPERCRGGQPPLTHRLRLAHASAPDRRLLEIG